MWRRLYCSQVDLTAFIDQKLCTYALHMSHLVKNFLRYLIICIYALCNFFFSWLNLMQPIVYIFFRFHVLPVTVLLLLYVFLSASLSSIFFNFLCTSVLEGEENLYAYTEKCADGAGFRCLLCGVIKDRRWNLRKGSVRFLKHCKSRSHLSRNPRSRSYLLRNPRFRSQITFFRTRHNSSYWMQCCRSGMIIPDPYFYLASLFLSIPDPRSNNSTKRGGGKFFLPYHFFNFS